eukprot:11402966-Alexandrium_andersonii.AAC.1
MSASLVGSEMCIRDSSSTTQQTAVARVLPRTAFARGLDKNDAPTITVSYTHLTLPTICSV